jgi:hypothetical protein
MSLYGSRDQLRRTYADAWRKRRAGDVLSPLEALIADVIEVHPEYQALIDDGQAAVGFEPSAATQDANPFLHLGLHLAVREQIAIDRPPGVRELHRRLQAANREAHDAEHRLMDALAQTLREAQDGGRAPDEARYLELARGQLTAQGRRS